MTHTRDDARARVDATPELWAHREAIILYEWPEGPDHWSWVCNATVDEIVNWAEAVEYALTTDGRLYE
jgi:hypothetical protein